MTDLPTLIHATRHGRTYELLCPSCLNATVELRAGVYRCACGFESTTLGPLVRGKEIGR